MHVWFQVWSQQSYNFKRCVCQNIWVSFRKTHTSWVLTHYMLILPHNDILALIMFKCNSNLCFLWRLHPDFWHTWKKTWPKTDSSPVFDDHSVWLNRVWWGEADCEAHWSVIYCAAHCTNHHILKCAVTTHYNTFIKTPVEHGSIGSRVAQEWDDIMIQRW